MDLSLRWVTVKDSACSADAWRVMREYQRVQLEAQLAHLAPGELQYTLSVRNRGWSAWRALAIAPEVDGNGRPNLRLVFSFRGDELGLTRTSFAARAVALQVTLREGGSSHVETQQATVYVMPVLQQRITLLMRWLAFAPLVPLVLAWTRHEISTAVGAWYFALTTLLGIVVQEQPLARISRILRAATRSVGMAVLTLGLLLMLEWTLLVRVVNRTTSSLSIAGMQLPRGTAGLTWRWSAPTSSHTPQIDHSLERFTVEPSSSSLFSRLAAGQFWQSYEICCRAFDVSCQTTTHEGRCDATPTCSRPDASELFSGRVALNDDCTIPLQAHEHFKIDLVLGREPGLSSQPDDPPLGSGEPACAGQYEIALHERAAYSGTRKARAAHAASFAKLVLDGSLRGVALHWKNVVTDSNGFISVDAVPPPEASDRCQLAIPVTAGAAIQVEIRGDGANGTLQCPSLGACSAYAIVQAYYQANLAFDGIEAYEIDQNRSVWLPLGASVRGFRCRCDGERNERPKQSTLRLSRTPPPSLQIRFESGEIPPRLDLIAAEQHSTLRCTDGGQPVFVEPLSLPFAKRVRSVEFTGEQPWNSEWDWFEGEHQAWSCTPAGTTLVTSLQLDHGGTYAYARSTDGARVQLRNCYFDRAGGVSRVQPRGGTGCQWTDASPEYAALVRSKHICARVLACR